MSDENQETIADIVAEIRGAKTEFPFVYLMGEPDTQEVIDAKTKEIIEPRKINIRRVTVNELADRIEAAAKRERESLIREEVDDNYHPNGWRVYVIEDRVLGFFAGFTNKGSPADVPMFCATIDGALKYDAFRDLASRERAVAIRNYYVPNAKVWAYKRHEIFPEWYRKEDKNVKTESCLHF